MVYFPGNNWTKWDYSEQWYTRSCDTAENIYGL